MKNFIDLVGMTITELQVADSGALCFMLDDKKYVHISVVNGALDIDVTDVSRCAVPQVMPRDTFKRLIENLNLDL